MGRLIPNAVYEMLRFGRAIGPNALVPIDIPHWRKFSHLGRESWINLNAKDVRKFSDADFPQWKNWQLIDDSADHDSRCDSQTIRGWLDSNHDGIVTPIEATTRLGDTTLAPRLAKVIAKFSTEWDKNTIDIRWGWLKTATKENPQPLSSNAFEEIKRHIEALSFWNEDIEISGIHWHWQPREFIRHFRKCGWLSAKELAQCIPRHCLSGTTQWNEALARANMHKIPLNKYFRKYYGNSRQRILHALAQIYIETGMLTLLKEIGEGKTKTYDAFYGRGYLQLTWAGNYKDYGTYEALPAHTGNYSDLRITKTSTHALSSDGAKSIWFPKYDPKIISEDLRHSGESSGFFWINKHFRGTSNINRIADQPHSLTIVAFICWLINGGATGYSNRIQFAKYIENILFDKALIIGTENYRYPPLTPSTNPTLCSKFPPVEIAYSIDGSVSHERQVP